MLQGDFIFSSLGVKLLSHDLEWARVELFGCDYK